MRLIKRLLLRLGLGLSRPHVHQTLSQENVEPGGKRTYILYIGIKEYNGHLKREIHFRNGWKTDEQAQKWLIWIKAEIDKLMEASGVESLSEERLILEEGAGQAEE